MSRRRGRRHPGVVILKPDESRRIWWRARYVDPDSGRTVKETLDLGLRTTELREDWAIKKSKALALRRLELEGGAPRATGTSLEDAVKQYYQDHGRLRDGTLEIYRAATSKLLAWAAAHRLQSADNLDGPTLARFRAVLVNEKRRTHYRGSKRGAVRETARMRSPATVNRELRAIGTVLAYVRALGFLPRLTGDGLRDSLKKLPLPVKRIDHRKSHELQKLLEAALRHDSATFTATRAELAGLRRPGSTPKHTPIAPILTTAILTGMRAGEMLSLDWSNVDLEALDDDGEVAGEIHITAASKTHHARTIGLEVAPALRRLLAAMHVAAGRPREGSVFGLTPGEAKAAMRRLETEFGAPSGSGFQALRRTAGTYLTNAPGVFSGASAYRSAKMLGHSVTIAERHYLGIVRGIPKEAKTLEAAMQLEKQVQKVIDRVSARGNARGEVSDLRRRRAV